MNEGVYFADAELPFHVWVRQRTNEGFRWVLREARSAGDVPADADSPIAPDGATRAADTDPAP